MMNADAMIALLGISGLVLLFYGPWQAVCVDTFRQYAFEQRDKLFDLAISKQFSFDDPEYRKARLNIEANIKFAERATFARVLFLWYFCNELKNANAVVFSEPFARSVGKVRRAMLISMYFRSAPLVIALLFVAPFAIVSALYIYALKRSVRAVWERAKMLVRAAESSWLVESVASKAEIEAQCA